MSELIVWNDTALTAMLLGQHGAVAIDLSRKAVRVESQAKIHCPVDTGRLRASITWWLDEDGEGLMAIVGTDVEYAEFVEGGTRYMEPRPYLEPALQAIAA